MLKITITKEFTSYEEAVKFLGGAEQRYAATPPPAIKIVGGVLDCLEHGEQPKRPRKGRSDAGQARQPYKPRGAATPAAPATTATPEVSTSANPTPQAASKAAPSGAAPSSAAPVESATVEPPQAAQAPVAADLTLEKVRETMGKLNAAKGRGMEACILSLREFGVTRISDLPPAKYVEFDQYLRDQLPKGA